MQTPASVTATLAGLTTRGRSFLAAGGAAAACALVLGQRDLLRVAVLLAAVPLLSGLVVARSRHRLALNRTIEPGRVAAGTPARVRLEVENLSRLSTGTLLAEERLPFVLGGRPRFVLDRLEPGGRAAVSYSVRSDVRGRFDVGPLRLRVGDPFGMCEVTRSFTATDPFVVIPRTYPLAELRAAGEWTGSGESHVRHASAAGEHDVATREYRHGDDLRRVHWRSTARRGELMVRRDEQPRQMRATVLVDRRRAAHRGEGPASSFEWAVSAAASVAVHLAAAGYGVRVLSDGTQRTWTGRDRLEGTGVLLDELAVVTEGGPALLADATATLVRGGGDGLVVAVLGEVDGADVMPLARLTQAGARGLAVLLDTPRWTPLPPRRRDEVLAARERSARLLTSGGWSVTTGDPAETVAPVWSRLLGRGPAARDGAA